MSWFRPQLKYLINLALPAVLSQLAQMGMGFIDTIMAGRHSKETLATVSIGTNFFFPVLIFVLGIFLSINPISATAVAQNKHLKLASLIKSGLFLAICFAIPVIFVLQNLEPAIALLGISEQMAKGTDAYLEAVSWGMAPMLMFLALRFFNEGLFSTKAIMYISLSALPLNVALNYVFLFKMNMGPAGLGYATALSYTYLFLVLFSFTFRYSGYKLVHDVLPDAHINKAQILEILKLGFPIAVAITLEVTLFAAIGLMIAMYGIDVVAGHQIAMNIASMTFMIPMGISIATTARVGYFYGLKDWVTAKRIGWIGTGLSAVMMVFSASFMWFFPETIVGFYTNDLSAIKIASGLLVFAALFQLVDGVQVTLSGALRGLHDTKIPMYISVLAYWVVGFPIGFYLAKDYQASGYWIGIILALTTAAILLTYRFLKLNSNKYQVGQ